MKSVNVFVVDDDDIYQFTIGVTLKSIPAVRSTRTFSDGAEALEYIVVHQNDVDELPDIIFWILTCLYWMGSNLWKSLSNYFPN